MAETAAKSGSLDTIVEKVGGLSKNARIGIIVGVVIVILLGAWYFVFDKLWKEIDRLETQLEQAIAEMREAEKRAARLEEFQAEMKRVQAQFDIAKRALPESEEIPSLLTSISSSGQDAGLNFLLFEPDKEEEKGFYNEIPINIKVTGSYHQLAEFFFKVSRLARIVNIRDMEVVREFDQKRADPTLQIAFKAVTYKFVEQPEAQPEEGGRGRRR